MSQQPLPAPKPTPAPGTGVLNLDNIQGDILLGLPKRVQELLFLQIKDVAHFKKGLAQLLPLITTTNQVLQDRAKIADSKAAAKHGGHPPATVPISGINIAFSAFGLSNFSSVLPGTLADTFFNDGQFKGAVQLGDPVDATSNTPNTWKDEFKQHIDLVILATGDCWDRVDANVKKIHSIFGNSVKEVYTLKGAVRPGAEKGHEHFGFLDGVSQPAVEDFNVADALPGQTSAPPGVFLVGERGDPALTTATPNPDWAKDGSILAFRQLDQLVPEFNAFLDANPIPGMDKDEGSALLGARLVGRWKSGAPVDLTPKAEDPDLGATIHGNNNFDFNSFQATNTDLSDDQIRCPYVAHIRKTNPRSDIAAAGITPHRIMRAGIPYGPEVTPTEKQHKKTEKSRGLAFVCYQSSLANGFQFVQTKWANNPGFVFGKPVQPGIDAIIGQAGNALRKVNGTDPKHPEQTADITLPTLWVIPKGGEYFFSPSLSTLKTIAT